MIFQINTIDDLVSAFGECKKELDKPHILTYKEGVEKRRDKQNRVYYHFLGQIAEQSGNGLKYERGYYKWTYGCPILSREDPWFNEQVYTRFMDLYDYEEIIDIMGTELINVTSQMNVKEMAEFLLMLKQDADNRGFVLKDESDEYFECVYGAKR